MIKLYVDLNIQRFGYVFTYEFIYTSKKEGYESGIYSSDSTVQEGSYYFEGLKTFIRDTIGAENLLTAKFKGQMIADVIDAESLFEGCTSLIEVDLSDLFIGDGRNI